MAYPNRKNSHQPLPNTPPEPQSAEIVTMPGFAQKPGNQSEQPQSFERIGDILRR